MSVLTERSGSTLPLDYSPSPRYRTSPSGPTQSQNAAATNHHNYTRPERKSSYTIYSNQSQPSAANISQRHSRAVSSNTPPPSSFQNPAVAARAHPSSHSHSRDSSISTTMNMQRQPTTTSISSGLPRRSTSGRSTATNSPTSYVALMRKQKATVWCDRSQNVDPRTAAAQKAAKHRAHLEVASNLNPAGSGRTSTLSSGGVVGKIRHGGIPKAPGYVPANLSGVGVPMRLSANEMLGDEEENRSFVSGDNAMVHGRSGSGKSSTNSAKYRSGYPRADQGRFSTASTPPSGEGSPSGRVRIPEETPTESHSEYFPHDKAPSLEEDSFGEFKELAGPSRVETAMEQAKKAEDLRRRGSVDERTMSMGTGMRLVVANPDIDSD